MASSALFIAFMGGLIPSLLWLSFWLLEDRCEPEPKKYLFITFFAGMLAVIAVLPPERYFIGVLSGAPLLLVWAILEETFKIAAALIALRSRALDEPLDTVIYMVTAALGFAAMENALFLVGPLQDGHAINTILTGDLRFIGATLLHVLASGTVGLAMAFAFSRGVAMRRGFFVGGLILAIALHTLFNILILKGGAPVMFSAFVCIWAGIVAVLFLTERIKQPARDYC